MDEVPKRKREAEVSGWELQAGCQRRRNSRGWVTRQCLERDWQGGTILPPQLFTLFTYVFIVLLWLLMNVSHLASLVCWSGVSYRWLVMVNLKVVWFLLMCWCSFGSVHHKDEFGSVCLFGCVRKWKLVIIEWVASFYDMKNVLMGDASNGV